MDFINNHKQEFSDKSKIMQYLGIIAEVKLLDQIKYKPFYESAIYIGRNFLFCLPNKDSVFESADKRTLN